MNRKYWSRKIKKANIKVESINLLKFVLIVILIFSIVGVNGCKRKYLNWTLPAFYFRNSENRNNIFNINSLLQNNNSAYILLYIWSKTETSNNNLEANLLSLNLLMKANKEKELFVLSININNNFNSMNKIIEFFNKRKVKPEYPMLWDQKGITKKYYGSDGIPTECILLDNKGEIVLKKIIYNMEDFELFKTRIIKYLNETENKIFNTKLNNIKKLDEFKRTGV